MDHFFGAVRIAVAQSVGHGHIGADGEAHEEIHQQVYKRACGGDGRQGGVAGVTAHHDDIGSVEEKLHNAGDHQGEGEGQKFGGQSAVEHVDLIVLVSHFQNLFSAANRGAAIPRYNSTFPCRLQGGKSP